MKTKIIYLFLIVIMITANCFAQSTIGSAFHFNFYNSLNYNPPVGSQAPTGPDYGCLNITSRPSWFYLTVCGTDTITTYPEVAISGFSSGQLDLIIWGPFDDTINIANRLTASNIDTCYLAIGSFIHFPHFQYPKFYYGMFSMDNNVTFGYMNRMWTGGYWFDGRCGICDDRVANYKQDICMVTIDSATQKNKLIWDKHNNAEIASFNIYREGIIAGQFDSIGNVPVTADGIFIDSLVNPNQRSFSYRMAAVDSCGQTTLFYTFNQHFDSALVHTTIHLQGSMGLNNEVNLSWNPYVGFPYNTFYIYRGSSSVNYQILDSVSSNTLSYTDYSAQPGINYYKVAVRKPGGCSPDEGTTVYSEARSNNPSAVITGIKEIPESNSFLISPNPCLVMCTITFPDVIKKGSVEIFNLLGETLFKESINCQSKQDVILKNISPGIYFVNVDDGVKRNTQKLVVQ